MKRYVYDIEANNLLEKWNNNKYETVDRVWCSVVKDIDEGTVWRYNNGEEGWKEGGEEPLELFDKLDEANLLIAHNQLGYDLPVLKKLFNWKPYHKIKIVDTYILSRLLNTERRAHSIEYWGKLLKREKVVHEDWTRYSEEMLHRCEEDVNINEMVYRHLLKEMR